MGRIQQIKWFIWQFWETLKYFFEVRKTLDVYALNGLRIRVQWEKPHGNNIIKLITLKNKNCGLVIMQQQKFLYYRWTPIPVPIFKNQTSNECIRIFCIKCGFYRKILKYKLFHIYSLQTAKAKKKRKSIYKIRVSDSERNKVSTEF